MAPASRKTLPQLIPNLIVSFPVRSTSNLSWGFEPLCNHSKIQNLNFSRKTAFERLWSAINFRYERTSCSITSELSSYHHANLRWKIFKIGWLFLKISLVFWTHPTRKSHYFTTETALDCDDTAQSLDLPLAKWLNCHLGFCWVTN